MLSKGTFQHVEFGPELIDFGAEFARRLVAQDDRLVGQRLARACIFDGEGLDPVRQAFERQAEPDEPVALGLGGGGFRLAQQLVSMTEQELRQVAEMKDLSSWKRRRMTEPLPVDGGRSGGLRLGS